ncbi:MAG: 3-deoxy-7-phosphoheptulonate synthase [Lachnospiraceae bacterium]|nr:3-deoxy-7-phosphoheptulonate synthase [Lachnospiraceae bacterium]
MNMQFISKLPSPEELINDLPLSEEAKKRKKENDKKIRSVITGRSDKFLLIIGPCSADRADSVLDYSERLARIQEEVDDKIIIIPRVYTNKPRTTAEGYMGMASQPDPLDTPDFIKGLYASRKLHLDVIEKTGLPTSDELLYPEFHLYLSDLLSYVAVGARSVENQQHRLYASGIDVPVGLKNPTSGDISVLMNSLKAAQTPHIFTFGGWEVLSKGNPFAHAILRGHVNKQGQHLSNYSKDDISGLLKMYEERGLLNPTVVIDTNHSNSGKNPFKQCDIALDVLKTKKSSDALNRFVKGLMIESYIADGSQNPLDTEYGLSITDPCLGWEKTEKLIFEIADLL